MKRLSFSAVLDIEWVRKDLDRFKCFEKVQVKLFHFQSTSMTGVQFLFNLKRHSPVEYESFLMTSKLKKVSHFIINVIIKLNKLIFVVCLINITGIK